MYIRRPVLSEEMRESMKKLYLYTFFLCILAFFLHFCLRLLTAGVQRRGPQPLAEESAGFRAMAISPEALLSVREAAKQADVPAMELLAMALYERQFSLDGGALSEREVKACLDRLRQMSGEQKEHLCEQAACLAAVWEDIVYFPVVQPKDVSKGVAYENSWMYERTYGGRRGHEGCDIMAGVNERGLYPIVSVSEGVVEHLGWLPKGGYRVGIRSPHGGYFYYAHLYSYAQDLKEGDTVYAGQLLGFMGDSGYGEEGTVGQFDVHLHLGIYVRTEHLSELSVNPYWILKNLEGRRLKSS